MHANPEYLPNRVPRTGSSQLQMPSSGHTLSHLMLRFLHLLRLAVWRAFQHDAFAVAKAAAYSAILTFFPALLVLGSILATSQKFEVLLREISYALGRIMPAGSATAVSYLHATTYRSVTTLVMTSLLTLLVSFYLGFHAKKMEPRPEDRKDGEIADGAGELGFFPPYSWWPLWCGLCLATIVYGVAMAAWWLMIIGADIGTIALAGWIFEYYRGEFKH